MTHQELDPALVLRAQAGEPQAQQAVLLRYVRPLHAFVRRSGAPGDVDDSVQELLHKLLIALPRFSPAGPATLTTWVFTVAHRWLLDERKRRHLQLMPLDEGLAVADRAAGAERLIERRELAAALESALLQLPEAQRRVFVLAHVHQHPLEAVAEVEGVPLGTIKSRLHRARAALAAALLPRMSVEGGLHALSR